jgi:hypothetical protein
MPAPKDPIAYALWKQRMSESRKGEKNGNYGKHMSEENKRYLSEVMTGKMVGEKNPMFGVHLNGYWKGKNLPEETKKKISEKKLGKPSWNKGLPSTWTKGIPRSDEVKAKISQSNKGKPKSEEHKQHLRKIKLETEPTGKYSWNWKGGITKLNLHIRTLPRYKNICTDLMKEVDYTDKFTGKRGGVLACHHIIPQNVIIRMYNVKTIYDARNCPLLFDKHNLIVMLSSAHDKFHNIYGDDKNIYELTSEQIKELYL